MEEGEDKSRRKKKNPRAGLNKQGGAQTSKYKQHLACFKKTIFQEV